MSFYYVLLLPATHPTPVQQVLGANSRHAGPHLHREGACEVSVVIGLLGTALGRPGTV